MVNGEISFVNWLFEKKITIPMCAVNASNQCAEGSEAALWAPQIFLFTAQFISGIGQPLYSTLGISYMDDNIQKSKTPAFVSK